MPEFSPKPSIGGWKGSKLSRPECAIAHSSGLLSVPCWSGNGGVSIINAQGETRHILGKIPDSLATWLGQGLKPNGIALEENGCFLLAHLGDDRGGVFRLRSDGAVEPVVLTVAGEPMPPTNYVVKDFNGRLWITVSTRKSPRSLDYRPTANTGFIAVCNPGDTDARIVADGLGYTNECVIDDTRGCVFVNETFAQKLTRFQLKDDASLHTPEVLTTFGPGTFPDGLALDSEGDLWVTSIVSNRVIRVAKDGKQTLLMEDCDSEHVDKVANAFASGVMGRPHLDNVKSHSLQNISNLAFGGTGLSKAYLGNLLGDAIPWIDMPVPGAPMPHWNLSLGELTEFAG